LEDICDIGYSEASVYEGLRGYWGIWCDIRIQRMSDDFFYFTLREIEDKWIKEDIREIDR